jgi:hypothetical protein
MRRISKKDHHDLYLYVGNAKILLANGGELGKNYLVTRKSFHFIFIMFCHFLSLSVLNSII